MSTGRSVGAVKQTGLEVDGGTWQGHEERRGYWDKESSGSWWMMSQHAASSQTAASVFVHVCQHTDEVTGCRTRASGGGGVGGPTPEGRLWLEEIEIEKKKIGVTQSFGLEIVFFRGWTGS